jgi:RNA polymerase sigma-70 factor (ECF subfamily)
MGVDYRTAVASATEQPREDVDIEANDDFERSVLPHWRAMAHLASRLGGADDGEDILQDALAAAWRRRAGFDPQRGSLRNWLLAIVADQARKSRRRNLRRPANFDRIELMATESPEAAIDLERALTRLSPRQRTAVALYYFLGLPLADVAAVMGCAQGTAKSTLADARTRIRSLLGEEFL